MRVVRCTSSFIMEKAVVFMSSGSLPSSKPSPPTLYRLACPTTRSSVCGIASSCEADPLGSAAASAWAMPVSAVSSLTSRPS